MDVFHHLEEIPANYGPTVVSVGNFDGVHRAHRNLIDSMVARARARGVRSVAVTFEPHPSRILQPDSDFKLLTPTPVKLRLLAETGLDAVLLLPFSRDLSLISPRKFVQSILVKALHAREVHEGFNFRFGHKAQGNMDLLRQLSSEFGFELHAYPPMRVHGEVVSSSRIRELLREGVMHRARQLLGRPFSIVHTPGRGRGYGSKYTVPTINLSRYDEMTPQDGVYVSHTRVAGECFESVTNVGNRPTFGEGPFAIETHLLNFHTIELTPETPVEIAFLHRLRPEIKFPSVEALRQQIAHDVRRARRYFHLLACTEAQRERAGTRKTGTSVL
jgi:riboflavin kinase/FMN adenylyltransferase